MKINSRKRKILLAVFCLLIVILVAVIVMLGRTVSHRQKIGFVMTGSVDEEGWNGMHYQGVLKACETLDTELLVKENVLEFTGQCGPAVEELVNRGCHMIILSSYGYVQEVQDIIQKYPDVAFYHNAFDIHGPNLTAFFSRMYQARYLAGIVAGMKTETNQIGYVAAMPTSEVNRGISAFTLGVKRVNPDAAVKVSWSNAWDDEQAERACADRLIEEASVDVLTYHQNQPYVSEEAEKYGIYSIGYHQSLPNASEKHLTAVVCDWQLTYEAIIRQYLRGNSAKQKVYWVGIDENAVKLSTFSPLVTDDIKEELDKAKNEMLCGKDVFSGVIYDNEGNKRCKENQAIRDEVLLEQFDWYVEGVEIYDR